MTININLRDGIGGTILETVTARSVEKSEALVGQMDRVTCRLLPEQWSTLDGSLDRLEHTLEVEHPDGSSWFTGRYWRHERQQSRYLLTIGSPEVDGVRWEPTDPDIVIENEPDDGIATDIIDGAPADGIPGVDTLTTGTIDQLEANTSFSLNETEASAGLRDLATETGAVVRYNADWSVDYLERRGSDRPGVIISSAAGTAIEDADVDRDRARVQGGGRDGPVTHLKGYGAGDGPDQLTYTAVADGFTSGDVQSWARYENTDIVQQSRLERVIDGLIEEINDEPDDLRVNWTVVDTDLEVGDRVTVQRPDDDIDDLLWVLETVHVLDEQGERIQTTFGNRPFLLSRDRTQALSRDITRFNRGYSGLVQSIQDTSGWDNAGDGHVQAMTVYDWPDNIETEIITELHVEARAWRAPLKILEHDHGEIDVSHAHTTQGHAHSFGVDATSQEQNYIGTWTTDDHDEGIQDSAFIETYTVDSNSSLRVEVSFEVVSSEPGAAVIVTIDSDNVYSASRNDGDFVSATHGIGAEDHTGSVSVEVTATTSDPFQQQQMRNLMVSITQEPTHDHEVQESDTTNSASEVVEQKLITETADAIVPAAAEIVTQFDDGTGPSTPDLPHNVDILVDNDVVTTLSGNDSIPWSATVDMIGELDPGDVDIEADPQDGRGELMLTFRAEHFRRGRS